MDVRIEQVPVEVVRPLRHAVLRPGRPASAAVWTGDDDAASVHLAALDGERVVAVVSLRPEPWQGRPGWRLRGMATAPDVRGAGHGARLLDQALRRATKAGVEAVWCNAREGAVGFYSRRGFRTVGERFETAFGPHFFMVCELPGAGGRAAGDLPAPA